MKNILKTLLLLIAITTLAFCFTACGDDTHTHTAEADDGDCTTAVECSECDEIVIEANETHTAEADDGDCTTAVECSECDEIVIEAKASHSDEGLDGECDLCSRKLDYILDESDNTYCIFTEDGLYAWLEDFWIGYNAILMKDIVMPEDMTFDLDGDGVMESNWAPTRISGTFDGNGHSITGVTIINPNADYIGFFTDIDVGGVISNLLLLDVNIRGKLKVGGIAGYNDGTIINCGVSGSIICDSHDVGGIVGQNYSDIIGCYNDAEVYAAVGSVGGIVGQQSKGDIIACYNTGNLSSHGTSDVGGIVGIFYEGNIIACYSIGVLTGSGVGGIAGCGATNDTLCTEAYWSTSGDSTTRPYSNSENVDGAYRVDGETISWAAAMNSMNEALATIECEYRYTLNTGSDSEEKPLVLTTITSQE